MICIWPPQLWIREEKQTCSRILPLSSILEHPGRKGDKCTVPGVEGARRLGGRGIPSADKG